MKRNIIFLLILSLCGCFGVKAQTTGGEMNPEEMPERFTLYYSAELLLDVYKGLTADSAAIGKASPRLILTGGGLYGDTPSLGRGWDYLDMPFNAAGGSGMLLSGGSWDIDNPRLPRLTRYKLREANRLYRHQYRRQTEQEKQRLVQYLHALNSEEERPLIFIDIRRDYGGDIERYVDDIYNRSILISHKRLCRFCSKPDTETFVSDPGVRFVVSMELFRNAQKLKALQATVDSVK